MPFSTSLLSKLPAPSAMHTAEWDLVPADIRARAFFMAGVTHLQTLIQFRKIAAEVAAGKLSPPEARRALREFLRELGYQAPEGKAGTIQDLSSRRRMDVVIDTNARMAAGWANYNRQLENTAQPGQRLVRVRQSRRPRNWAARWKEAAEAVGWEGVARGGQMVALLSSPIWRKLSRFGLPYPPYDFNSGMGVLPVRAKECQDLGLYDPETTPDPNAAAPRPSMNEGVTASVQGITPDLLDQARQLFEGVAEWDEATQSFTMVE